MNFSSNPKLDSIVFGKLSTKHSIKNDDLGIYFVLEDYNNLEAYISCSEINRWKVNLPRFFSYDKSYPFLVLSYDKNMPILSYSKIKQEQRDNLLKANVFQNKYVKLFNKILSNLKNSITSEDVDKLINIFHTSFPGDDEYKEVMFNNSDVFETSYYELLNNPLSLFEDSNESELADKYVDEYNKLVVIKPYTLNKEFKLKIFNENGLNILKSIFSDLQTKYTEFEFKCVSSPTYLIQKTGLTYDEDKKIFEQIESDINQILDPYLFDLDMKSELKQITSKDFSFSF